MKFIVALSALVLLNMPANAGWQYTEWGMSPSQVVSASGEKVRLDKGPAEDQSSDRSVHLEAKGTHKSGTHTFDLSFYFEKNLLAFVKLKLRDETKCSSLVSDLKSVYGTPYERLGGPDEIAETLIWHSKDTNNKIRITNVGNMICQFTFYPLLNSNTSGL